MIISLTNYDNIKFNAVLEDNLVAIYDAQLDLLSMASSSPDTFKKQSLK
jgi:hypothetical protein